MCCDEVKVNKVGCSGFAVYILAMGAEQLPCDHVHYCSAVWLPHHVHHLQELLVSGKQIYLGTLKESLFTVKRYTISLMEVSS